MRAFALAGLIAATFPLAVAADVIPGTEFSSGYWYGAAYTGQNGQFLYCDVSVGYTNGEVLWMGLYTDDTLAVLLSHPDVSFTPGEKYDSWLMLETGMPIRDISEAWDASYAGMTLTGIDGSIDFLSSGQWLRLLGIGIDAAYDVTGIREALGLARACYGKNSGRNPFATATPPAPADPIPDPAAVDPVSDPAADPPAAPALGTPRPPPKVPDLTPKPGGGLGTNPGGALGTPAPKPQP